MNIIITYYVNKYVNIMIVMDEIILYVKQRLCAVTNKY